MVIIIGSPKSIIVSRASETHCGPAKIDFGWPDWPASEKVKHDPCNISYEINNILSNKCTSAIGNSKPASTSPYDGTEPRDTTSS